jgi:hypothetical protein
MQQSEPGALQREDAVQEGDAVIRQPQPGDITIALVVAAVTVVAAAVVGFMLGAWLG